MSNSMTMSSPSSLPSSDELRSFMRQLRSNLHIHRQHPPEHPMQAKALELLHKQLTHLTQNYGPLFMAFDGSVVRVNNASLETYLTDEQQSEIASLFLENHIQTLTFSAELSLPDLARLFANLFEEHRSYDSIPSLPTLQALLPSIGINQYLPSSDVSHPLPMAGHDVESIPEHPIPAIHGSSQSLPAQQAVPSSSHSSYTPIDAMAVPEAPSGIGPLPSDPSGLVPLPPEPLMEQTKRGSQPDLKGMDLGTWLQSKEALATFHQWFAAQRHLSSQLENSGLSSPKTVQAAYVIQDIRTIHRRVLSLLNRTQSAAQAERITKLAFQQLSNLSPTLWVQHFVVLFDPGQPQLQWGRELLYQCNSHGMQRLMHALFLHIEAEANPPESSHLLIVVQECLNSLFLRNQEETLLGFLRHLNPSDDDSLSPHRQNWQNIIHDIVAAPERLEQLYSQARQPGADSTQQLLAQLCTASLPFGIFQLPQIRSMEKQEQQVALLLLIAYYAPPHHCDIALRKVLSALDTLPDIETQEFCFSLCCQFAPSLLESYIFQRLSTIEDPRLRRRLLQQAVASNTPRMRLLLKQLLEQDNFTHEPDQEEWLLHYLHEHKAIDVLRFLQGRIYNPDNDLSIRHNAVWMLGSFPNKKSLKLLEQILTNPPVESEAWKSLQYQAVHTLGRMPFSESWSLLREGQSRLGSLQGLSALKVLHESVPKEEAFLRGSRSTLKTPSPNYDEEPIPLRTWIVFGFGLVLIVLSIVLLAMQGSLGF